MLVNCTAYRQGHKLADISLDEIDRYLAQPDCFIWVALRDAGDDELAQLQQAFGLHPLAVEDARCGHERPKIEEYGDSLFVVMHLLEREGEGDAQGSPRRIRVGELDVFAGPRYVVSVRNRSAQNLGIVRERCEHEPELLRHGAGFVLYALIDEVVDRYFPLIEGLEDDLEAMEKEILTERASREHIKQLYGTKRRLRVLKHAVAPLLEGVQRLDGGRVPPLCAGLQAYFRDVIDHLVRINGLTDAIREGIGAAIQVNLSLVTIADGEVTKRLAAWACIFAVCTVFVGVWGMNFQNMPELKWHYGYPAALGLIVAVCGALYWRFRRAGWL